MFESLSTRLQDVFKTLRGRVAADAREHRGGAARDSARAARSRRQLQGRQGVRRPRARSRDGRGRGNRTSSAAGLAPSQQVVKIVRDEMVALFGNAEGGLQPTTEAAARDPDARPAGRRQDDDRREAGDVADEAGQASAAGLDGRQASGGDSAAERRRGKGRRSRARSGRRQMDPVARAKGAVAEARDAGLRRGDRRHRGPAAHRRRADGGARRDQGRDRSRRICCSSPTR